MPATPMRSPDAIEELHHDWREATADWLEARAHFERLQAGACTDRRALTEAAQRVELTAHRRATLSRDAAALAQVLDSSSQLRSCRPSER